MTALDRAPWTSGLREGCTAEGCGTQNTEFLSGWHGRRCAAHEPSDPTTEETTNDCA